MNKSKLLTIAFLFSTLLALADEGMWLLQFLGDKTYQNMVRRGLKLSREQLHSLNKSSLKDAIIIFGGGCTGEIVSGKGLIFTNHHCGYGAIAGASTVEKNHLRDGFWAKSFQEEIPSPGLSVQFLRKVEDVTAEVEAALAGLEGPARAAKLNEVSAELSKKLTAGTTLEARVVPFFKNNQYLAFCYERFKDIRLVGTPPESIGKFGGDTDNWEWPRHTGDFSVFRVYTAPDGKAADHAPTNIPMNSPYHLPVSIKGVKDGDYAMILGYPGGTNRYETSFGVKLKTEIENPAIVNLRDARLKLMFDEMRKSDATRLQLASSYAGIANYWKFFDGERKQLLKFDVFGQKQRAEQEFLNWAAGKEPYASVFAEFDKAYQTWWPYARHRVYMNEGLLGSPLIAWAASLQSVERALTKKTRDEAEVKKVLESAARSRKAFIEQENRPSDQNILAVTTYMFWQDIDPSQHPQEFFNMIRSSYGDPADQQTYRNYAKEVFGSTMVLDDAKWSRFAEAPDSATLQNDPAYRHFRMFYRNYSRILPKGAEFNARINDLGRIYLKGVLEMNKGREMYPDANFTMRMSYGNVKSYRPRDAVNYSHVTTLQGVLDKYRPGDYEFDLPANLIDAAKRKDFGRYADPKTGDLVVGFITTNDITGGNSGSPVINARGELIGLAFDGNYEALSHKIAFDKDLNRTICVDVRYVLWCMEKLGGATNLISELTLR